ncbi:MAG: YceI family protein [Rhodocyclaceae bacterium]
MKRILLLCLLLAWDPAVAAGFDRVLPERSAVAFTFKQMGVAVEGRFRRLAGRIAFDPARPQSGSAELEVDLGSIDAGSDEAGDEARSRNWFDLARFPAARFVSTGVAPLGGGRYRITGRLTIKGITRELSVPASFVREGALGRFEGGFALKRLEFRIGEGVWADTETVADEVQVRFRIVVAPA